MAIRNPRDFWAGAIYLMLAIAVVWIGRSYAAGSAERMGPGYFPTALGTLLGFIGVISVGRSFLRPGEPIGAFAWRPLILVLGAIVLFGLLLPTAGVLIALPCLIVVGALASRQSRLDFKSAAALIGVVAFCVLVFVKGLGVPMPLLGSWLVGLTMEMLGNLALGFQTAMSLSNLLYCLVGVFLGTAVGVLPGIGPIATIAMLLPITFGLPPVSALIMLSGIYYGAQYGGSTTAILINLPGESASVVTALDGYRMARQGKAGLALATAAIGSFIAGSTATLLVALFAPPLAEVALRFGPAEYFSLMVLGLVASVVLASGSLLHAVGMVVVGLVLGLAGTDVNSGVARYSFGFPQLADGIGFVVIAMGMFGLAEIVNNLAHEGTRTSEVTRVEGLLPSREEWKRILGPIWRGTVIGSVLGILPGGGAILASFASYALEKKLSKTPEQFGKGAVEGVAGPESANNAGAQTSFIPMLTLGIPANPVMALMIGALMIQGIQPGPTIITEQATLFWGVVVSMWIGNVFLLILNLPLIGLWVRMVTVPYHLLYPAIMVFCAIGVFSISNQTFDVYLMALFGLLGYVFHKLGCEPTPLLLGFILGPPMEEFLRRALILSEGRPDVLLREPLSAGLLALAALLMMSVLLPAIRQKREQTFVAED